MRGERRGRGERRVVGEEGAGEEGRGGEEERGERRRRAREGRRIGEEGGEKGKEDWRGRDHLLQSGGEKRCKAHMHSHVPTQAVLIPLQEPEVHPPKVYAAEAVCKDLDGQGAVRS